MSVGWVAGTVRARSLLSRRIGDAGARALAAEPTLEAATRRLAATTYRRFLPGDATLEQAQRAVGDTVLWNLRVLAGWVPNPGLAMLRVLVAEFEVCNLVDHLRALSGEPAPEPYRLGALTDTWNRAAATRSPAELRQVLAASPWGDPGADTPAALVTGLRLSAAGRLAELHQVTQRWGAAAAALLIARQRFLVGRAPDAASAARARSLLGERALGATDWRGYTAALPRRTAGWVLAGIDGPRQLWLAEAGWWTQVTQDAEAMVHTARFNAELVLGCAALLLSDAHAVRAALERAARGGGISGGADVLP
ncbi:MAG TPA: hypothetical protein VFU74_07240 [Actinocrinis sp.]|nr:hypothetical protein [Actinocrinis sp.]